MKRKILSTMLLGVSLFSFGAYADDSIGGLSARVDDLEKRMNGQTSGGDEIASKEEIEVLRAQVRELRGEIEELRHGLTSLKNAGDTGGSSSRGGGFDAPKPTASEKVSKDIEDDDIDDLLKNLSGDVDARGDPKNDPRKKVTQDTTKNAKDGTLESGDSTAQYNQALALFKAKEYGEAEEAFRFYLTQFKSGKQVPQAKLKVAQCQLALSKETKDKKRAKEASGEFAALYKTNSKGAIAAECLLGMADSLGVQGESKKAAVVLKKLQTDFPNDKEACKKASDLLKKYDR